MEITEVRVKLAENQQERLLAFCTVTFDHGFVVRDVKVIEGLKGPFIAMPSRKVTGRCHQCGEKNHLKSRFCNHCGRKLDPPQVVDDSRGRPRLYVDIAHPINQKFRTLIETRCIAAYREELQLSRQPGYVAHDLDDLDDASQRRSAAAASAASPVQDAGAQTPTEPAVGGQTTGSATAQGRATRPAPPPQERHRESSSSESASGDEQGASAG